MARLSLSLLGSFRASLDDQPVAGFESNKVRALLAYLAVEADRPHSRDELIGLLWPDRPDQIARSNLSQALANLRRAIGDQAALPPFLRIPRDSIQFNTESDYRLDVAASTTLLDASERHAHRRPETCKSCANRLREAAELYRGDFLDQFFLSDSAAFEEWALAKRERLRGQALGALYRLADYHERREEYGQAHRYAARQLELEPWLEAAQRQAMRALASSGQRSAALAQYETCRRLLTTELGVEPETETTRLYEQIRAGQEVSVRGGLPASLPVPPTPLVGREEELAELVGLLENPARRLVSLVGPGGIGKTRLALQTGIEHAGAFADGAYFVSLAPLSSAEFLVPAIAGALKVTLSGQEDPRVQLLNYLSLANRDMLLILDNFEHLLEGADLLAETLTRAPGVTLVVTSRERLNLQGEWVVEVEGLRFPENGATDRIESYSAVELFLQSAHRIHPRFELSEAEAAGVVRICQLVAGMPLGIELAAAWVRTLSCKEIATEIERTLSFLATSLRDVPARHRSLRAAFDHSWKLLSEEERSVFRDLCVFRGGIEREAAEQVAGASLPLLSALMDKSFLRRDASGRYHMHELLRQYGYEKLQEAEATAVVRGRHRDWFLALAEQSEPRLWGLPEVAWMNRLEMDHDNLRTALEWSMEKGEAVAALRLAGSLWLFWWRRGYVNEGWERLSRALSGPETKEPGAAAARAKALLGAGGIQWGRGNPTKARPLLEEAVAIGSQSGDKWNMAMSLRYLGIVATSQGDYAGARSFLERSAAIILEPGVSTTSDPTPWLGDVAFFQADYGQAQRLYEKSGTLLRELGDKGLLAYTLRRLGFLALRQGDHKRASALFRESLSLNIDVRDDQGELPGASRPWREWPSHADRRLAPRSAKSIFGARRNSLGQ